MHLYGFLNRNKLMVILVFMLFQFTLVAQDNDVAQFEKIRDEHIKGELFLYINENLCPGALVKNNAYEKYIGMIKYGEMKQFDLFCSETDPVFQTESKFFKTVQNHPYFKERIYIIKVVTSVSHTCFMDFKIIENEEDENIRCREGQ